MKLSIIIPALNEAEGIMTTLAPLQALRRRGHEVILVDGGSVDGTVSLAAGCVDRVVQSTAGRAVQMNSGAAAATGDVFLFLHADTIAPEDTDRLLAPAAGAGPVWGRFDVCLSGRAAVFRIIAFFMNLRSRLTGIATGDQGIFVSRELFRSSGGFAHLALMEDIEFCRRLRSIRPPVCLRQRVVASSRYWERHGVVAAVLKMWWLRLRYALGADPKVLARKYYGA